MDVSSLNKSVLAKHVPARLSCKEGIREIECILFREDKLVIIGSIGSDCVLWYSTTKVSDVETNEAIIKLIMDTAKEPNKEWHCAPLTKIMEAICVPYYTLNDGISLHFKATSEAVITQQAVEVENLALELVHIYEDLQTKCLNFTMSEVALREIADKLKKAKEASSPSLLQSNYLRVREEMKLVEELSYLKLSGDDSLRNAYFEALKAHDDLYNTNMSVSR